jgi:transcriptional regulator with XRE-family HTH domain
MRKKFRDLVAATMSPEAQRKAHEMAQKELQKMELAELREALHVSQAAMARKLKVTQVAISRLERRPNIKVGSIINYLNALGVKLEMRAVLPDRTVELNHVLANGGRKRPAGKARVRRAQAKSKRSESQNR